MSPCAAGKCLGGADEGPSAPTTSRQDHRGSIRGGRQAFEGAADAVPPVMRRHSELGPERPGEGAFPGTFPPVGFCQRRGTIGGVSIRLDGLSEAVPAGSFLR